jgi:hypothetical protein
MAEISFQRFAAKPIAFKDGQATLGELVITPKDFLAVESPAFRFRMVGVINAARDFEQISNSECKPQLAMLAYCATGHPRLLDRYFPLTSTLDQESLARFDRLAGQVARSTHFDLRFLNEGLFGQERLRNREVRYFVAAQLVEVYFYRSAILQRFLSSPRRIRIYTTRKAFRRRGGFSGGNYTPRWQRLQLELKRLFEGFYGKTPGTAPFLHELGHMLDHFDAGRGHMRRSGLKGGLPGLHESDKNFYNPRAAELFAKGKRLEIERYQMLTRAAPKGKETLPIGHPYVFQNDREFIAGYFEMFHRNPNFMAEQNPDLFAAFCELFGWDPRTAWDEDFPYYVKSNLDYYLTRAETPAPHGLSFF